MSALHLDSLNESQSEQKIITQRHPQLQEQIQDNVNGLIFLSELKINKGKAFGIGSGLVRVFDLVGSIELGYKIVGNRPVKVEENAKEVIEKELIKDMENGKLNDINHIKLSPDYLLHLLIQGALSIDDIRRIRVIDDIIIVNKIGFNLGHKTKYINLICVKDIQSGFASFDNNGDIL